ncbi:MAG: pyrroloquinoline quinone-dependent dehydrogenase [Vicinamibacterales bacterium]|nr:pyrroloquinoline quinone-dependent dehydrogenase [Vicinamibacterales bacterium]
MRLNGGSMLAVIVGCALGVGQASAQQGATGGEWRSHSGDLGATKYSPLDQITADNFADLEMVWHWLTVDTHLARSTGAGTTLVAAETLFDLLEQAEPERWAEWDGVRRSLTRPSIRALVATPLMVNGVLYLSTALYRAAAIDARTGETLWVHDPRAYESGSPPPLPWRHRGVAYWEDDGVARVFWGTGDGFLIAVDAMTGLPAEEFGDHGRVDLTDGLPRAPRERRDILNLLPISSQSPPLVVRDTVIVGSSINDRALTKEAPPGWVRAYDVRTGRPKWDFHTVPQGPDEFGADTWLDDSWRYSGNTNVWSLMSGDDELGFAYLPIGTATNDYYGGHRLGHNLFAESLVAVDAETGQRQWHFQMVHHGLWDYDLPAAPNLLDITVGGRQVKAVAQVSKQGFVYAFDRVTGEPIWPIEERAVPTDTDLEGEVPSPTQPFPTRPAPFEYQGTSIDDLVDFTPEIRQLAVAAVDRFRLGPLFTPQMLAGTIMRPSVGGGANWSGAAVDPETGVLYVPSVNAYSTIGISAPEPHEQQSTLNYIRRSLSAGPVMPRGLPLWKPPYSRMTAIDMNTGDHAWMTPTGNGDRIRNHPMLRDLDLPPLGGDAGRTGSLLTRTLLIHALVAGGSDGGPRLVAYDKATGAELASLDLPGGALGAPMTYLLDGRQHIALTVGGEVSGLVAFRLPE